MSSYTNLLPGDPAPSFKQRSIVNPRFTFDTAAGRYLVLGFFGSASDPHSQSGLAALKGLSHIIDDQTISFFGVSNDPEDETKNRISDSYPGYRVFWDFDRSVSRLYGVAARETEETGDEIKLRRQWVVIDPTLRILKVFHFQEDQADIAQLTGYLQTLPPPERFSGEVLQAPIIVLPNVFEPELCKHLIDLYTAHGGESSGFMREVNGKTVGMSDPNHKRRRDHLIEDHQLIAHLKRRFLRRVAPEIAKVHQFNVSRMERFLVACYSAEDRGHFRAHRDNTTKGTAHRRFAVSVNLNADFDGGEVSFPEYGPRSFKASPGTAVVFSCSLLHAVSPVTRGQRFAFLPFLYDEQAAQLREKNMQFVQTTDRQPDHHPTPVQAAGLLPSQHPANACAFGEFSAPGRPEDS
ncbi:2OG-Fe(II) oxygenase [Roseibium sp. RKSG952]|uniref:2OG-Fe(II) oxygenase n=1 Tax=Roseibium sp. RKSG952 TaxID=2529384 RepID=UPI0012BC43BD|nr:2OG-Fe(II) oxygenase [Roseibium sp. RKSG952]MTH97516.1 redoxin domain-containing protein [Roseibium sp. RKSG952]